MSWNGSNDLLGLVGHYEAVKDSDGNPVMAYGGDADLRVQQNGTADYTFHEFGDRHAAYGGVDQATGELVLDKGAYETKLVYSSDANYIIFRDIDLNDIDSDPSGSNWVPLTFSGVMRGAKSEGGAKLWDDAASGFAQSDRPVISNMRIFQRESLDVGERGLGIGFFATLHGEMGKTEGVLGSAGSTEVSGLVFENALVETSTTETHYDRTLVSGLLGALGGLLGGLLDLVLGILGIDVHMSEILTDLLDARKVDPTALATGVFAGRVTGSAVVSNCSAVNSTVTSANSSLGGFVGYTEGVVSYATDDLGQAVDLLAHLLNLIPGVGLGDIVTVLLDNGLAVGRLVPLSYDAPLFSQCAVSGLNPGGAVLGSDSSRYIGGFAGLQVGAAIEGCSLDASALIVRAASYGGGFSGLTRDAEIPGVLSGLGVDLVRFPSQSTVISCSLSAGSVSVSGGDSLGGFVGALANSYAIDDSMSGSISVVGAASQDGSLKGSCVGGFAGIATTGWVTNLGANQSRKSSLFDGVGDILDGLLDANPDRAHALLSLAGVAPSAIMGCQIHSGGSSAVEVEGQTYVGGVVGKGDALDLGVSSPEKAAKLPGWAAVGTSSVGARPVVLEGLVSVTAHDDYAGGIAGSLGAASVGGVLDGALGVASFLGFDAEGATLEGASGGFSVVAKHYAGGAFGEAVGGDARSVSIRGLSSVQAENCSGGFAGVVGPGDLASTGGLTLNLLGLGGLLKVDSLLSVIPGVRVHFEECAVTGVTEGAAVRSTGGSSWTYAGGFAAYCNSAEFVRCRVDNLQCVVAPDDTGRAGGFAGASRVGDLADLAGEDGSLSVAGSLIEASKLLGTVGYLIPSYTNCTASYVDGGFVQADIAGGFAGELESGVVDNGGRPDSDRFAVYNIDRVLGQSYAGGFGGVVRSGALADAARGISILGASGISIDISDLLRLVEAYIPYISSAGVKSDRGFSVQATRVDVADSASGSAGGYIGYASGAQISSCMVSNLAATNVAAPDDLEAPSAPGYFDGSSAYAVEGGRYAGGFIGCMDVGSAASVGEGLKVLGSSISLSGILKALSVVVTTVEHSSVQGAPGGFSLLANGQNPATAAPLGHAGGFVGALYGGHVQDSHTENFEYVIGQETAGGFVGVMEPGDVTRVVSDGGVLGTLVNANTALASLLQSFVPTIRNSTTDCVPCGGAVRAQALSSDGVLRGAAGGFVGHNMGGGIWGKSADAWKDVGSYDGPMSECRADRIRSVYGGDYAGGFCGIMEAADTAAVGGLSILQGLISANNVLGALSAVYPVQRNTAVCGPLARLDVDTWNAWVEHVGVNGGFGSDLSQKGPVASQDELDSILSGYVYGCDVAAGRDASAVGSDGESGGAAGGYAGVIRSGVVRDGVANDIKNVDAMRAAGGYVGIAEVGGAARLGSVSIIGLTVDLGSLLQAVEVFVPVIEGSSSVAGYSHGMTVRAFGTGDVDQDAARGCGYAGGYAGLAQGAQIWGDGEGSTGCNVGNLRLVKGTNAVGGFVGSAAPGTLANVNDNASEGFLQDVIDTLVGQSGDLASILEATVTTIRGATVSPDDSAWGYVVDGSVEREGSVRYARAVGGFAGSAESAVIGDRDGASDVSASGLRAVFGGRHAGGFVGLTDVGSVASVGDSGATTSVLDLIGLGNVTVLDAFRTYIYHANVVGVDDGAQIRAVEPGVIGTHRSTSYEGNAGGFVGSVLNGSIKDSSVENLLSVSASSYAGGFAGYAGKNGTVDIDSANVGVGDLIDLLGAQAGVLDVWGAHIESCAVSGVPEGATVSSAARADTALDERNAEGAQNIAGGFVGLGDLSRISDCAARNLGVIRSDQVAGGFIGQTDMSYVVDAQVSTPLLNVLLVVVDQLVQVLYLDKGQDLGVIDLGDVGIPGLVDLLGLKVLSDGNLVYVNVLGLKISVSLSQASADDPTGQQRDVAVVSIGDSTIKLSCDRGGLTDPEEANKANLEAALIKGNRTVVHGCTASGAQGGYDVFGGGASQTADGAALGSVLFAPDASGFAGGFVGHNKEGVFESNEVIHCDVVRGTSGLVGPFSGKTDLESSYKPFSEVSSIEGSDSEGSFNTWSIYRVASGSFSSAATAGGTTFAVAQRDDEGGSEQNRYKVHHFGDVGLSSYDQLKGAVLVGESGVTEPIDAYVSPAKAVLMDDSERPGAQGGITPEPGEGQDPCDANVRMTLQKVWNDNANAGGFRPESISLRLLRTWTDAAGTVHEEQVDADPSTADVADPFVMTSDDASAWTQTWRKVIEGLPVATRDASVQPAKICYYTYYVEEVSYGAYTADISYGYTVSQDETGYVVTITNSLPLPNTGGAGVQLFLWSALACLILACAWFLAQRRRARAKAVAGNVGSKG